MTGRIPIQHLGMTESLQHAFESELQRLAHSEGLMGKISVAYLLDMDCLEVKYTEKYMKEITDRISGALINEVTSLNSIERLLEHIIDTIKYKRKGLRTIRINWRQVIENGL